jgi:hypothetical protein
VTLRNYQPVAWVLHQRVIDQSKADIFIKPGIMMGIPVPCASHKVFRRSMVLLFLETTDSFLAGLRTIFEVISHFRVS